MKQRRDIINELRSKDLKALRKYADEHGIAYDKNTGKDTLINKIADKVIEKSKMSRGALSPRTRSLLRANGGKTEGLQSLGGKMSPMQSRKSELQSLGGKMSPMQSRKSGLQSLGGKMSPRTRSLLRTNGGKTEGLGSMVGSQSPRQSLSGKMSPMQSRKSGLQSLSGKMSPMQSRKSELQSLGGLKQVYSSNGGEEKFHRWCNKYDCGIIPADEDERGISPRSRKWQEAMRKYGGLDEGASVATAAVVADPEYVSEKEAELANGGEEKFHRWCNKYDCGIIPADEDERGISPRSRKWQNSLRKAGLGEGKTLPEAAKEAGSKYVSLEEAKMGLANGGAGKYGYNDGRRGRIQKVTPEIDELARQIVAEISGGDMLMNEEQYTEAVRALAGERLSSGGKVSAVQATKALDPYYMGKTERSNGTTGKTLSTSQVKDWIQAANEIAENNPNLTPEEIAKRADQAVGLM